ncbi:MAG: hypothetical protein GXY18_12025, partial [Methanomicrobiales archaeon]|nr:hypothetical protein [Methanomicrobiales archaeon]
MKNEIDKKITILLVVAGVIGGCIGGFIPILSAFFEDSTINAIVIYPPDYYSIIRGGYHHPSDILVIPLHIVNEYNSPAYISNLTITLNKVNSNSTIEKGATTFILKGEFSSISKDEFENKFRYRESFIVDKKSSLTTFGAFRINQYWDINNKQAREFKFKTP